MITNIYWTFLFIEIVIHIIIWMIHLKENV